MFIKASANVELDPDQVGDVIVQALLTDYGSLANSVQALTSRSHELEDYEREDLRNDLEYMQAMDTVLSYYMTYDRHETFRRTWKKFVKLYDGEPS